VGSFTRRGTFDLVSRARCRFTGLVIVTCFPKNNTDACVALKLPLTLGCHAFRLRVEF
jgi:hypothetical protein